MRMVRHFAAAAALLRRVLLYNGQAESGEWSGSRQAGRCGSGAFHASEGRETLR